MDLDRCNFGRLFGFFYRNVLVRAEKESEMASLLAFPMPMANDS